MKKILFIFILISISMLAFGQRENTLPLKGTSAGTDTIRVVKDNQSSLMLRSVLQGAIYDSLATHTDTLQALRADIDAGLSADLSDSIAAHRIELNNLHDSIDDHRIDIYANLDSIAVHRGELDDLSDSITAHRTDINTNTSTGSTNATNISANSVFISTNTTDIGSLEDSIAKHTDTLQVHQTQIAALYDTSALHLDTLQLHRTQIAAISTDVDSSWTSINADTITEYTTAHGVLIDDVLLLDNDIVLDADLSANIFWQTGGSGYNSLLTGGTSTEDFLRASTNDAGIAFSFGSSGTYIDVNMSYHDLVPNDNALTDLGRYNLYFDSLFIDQVSINDASTTIYKDGSNNLTFNDAVTGVKTLADLSASGTADSSWTSITVDTIKLSSDINILESTIDAGLLEVDRLASSSYVGTRATYSSSARWDVIGNQTTFGAWDDENEKWAWQYVENAGMFQWYNGNIKTQTTTNGLQVTGGVRSTQYSGSLTDGAPTDAQIDSATGTTPSSVGAGWMCTILDTDGSQLIYIVVSDGTNWQYTALIIAT